MLRHPPVRRAVTGLTSAPAFLPGPLLASLVLAGLALAVGRAPREAEPAAPSAPPAGPEASPSVPPSAAPRPAPELVPETLAALLEPAPHAPPRPQPVPAAGPYRAVLTSGESSWNELSAQVSGLEEEQLGGDFAVGGFVKMTAGHYDLQDDHLDRSYTGFSLDALRLQLEGEVEPFSLYVSLAGEDPLGGGFIAKTGVAEELQLLDAYVAVDLADWVEMQVGAFRSPVLFSASLEENEQLLINRTFGAWLWQTRDLGAMVHGSSERLDWWLAVQNGEDGALEESSATGRVDLRAFGEGEAQRREGAFDADLGQTMYLGAAYHVDTEDSDADVLAADLFYTYDRLSLSGEISEYGPGTLDLQQWVVTGAYMLVPETWELALRYEDFGRRADDLVLLGVNRYLDDFRSRLQVVLGRFEHDAGGDRVNLFQVGLVVSL